MLFLKAFREGKLSSRSAGMPANFKQKARVQVQCWGVVCWQVVCQHGQEVRE
jgi:hypothetical protein